MKKTLTYLALIAFFYLGAQEHPNLILTQAGVDEIRANLGKVPFFDAHLAEVKAEVDAEIEKGIFVPIPKDMAGGYTHERHKQNFFILQKAGALYQILQEDKYAAYVKAVLMEYAAIYKGLQIHPQPRSYARGKLFWQCLNDANWLVYVSQAYDCVFNYLSKKERKYLESELFRPYADYISIENPQYFNRIHNHSTWGSAAVGMIGLVMQDEELIQRALYGLKDNSVDANAKDNDGGFIMDKGGKAGFLANIDAPFSPEGYYTEAPYYQRYAMYPYLLFATGLHNARPQEDIWNFKQGVLLKAVNTLLNLTDTDGEFYPLNDAQKGMSYYSRELVSAVDIAYHYGNQDPGLLSIAKTQNKLTLDDAGFAVAKAIAEGKATLFEKTSMEITDGPQGKQGGISIIRSGEPEDELNLLVKYTAHGNSHGHYDKLSYSLYHRGEEVLQDYGLARFVNIDQKNGGGYLKENTSWAKQTIAHNTLVLDETSHFGGNYEVGSKYHSEKYFSATDDTGSQWISVKENNAYPGTNLHRTLILLENKTLDHPLTLDLFRVQTNDEHQYDLPFHYFGQLMSTNFEYTTTESLSALGTTAGYQHLWLKARGQADEALTQISWLSNETFKTLTSVTDKEDEILFTQLGASDPEFNLRQDPAFILRRNNKKSTLFVNAIEVHGSYSPVTELAKSSVSKVKDIKVELDTQAYTIITLSFTSGESVRFCIANQDASLSAQHSINLEEEQIKWVGPYNQQQLK